MNKKKLTTILILFVFSFALYHRTINEEYTHKKSYLYIYQKAINHPYSGNSDYVHSDCISIDLDDKNNVFDRQLIKEFKEKQSLKVPYIKEMKETTNYFYFIQNVSQKYGDNFTYLEGLLWVSSQEECNTLKNKVKSLVEKYTIEDNEKLIK